MSPHSHNQAQAGQPTVLMLLTNAYDPDPRVRQEAVTLLAMGCRVRLLAWDRDHKAPPQQNIEGVEVERVGLRSTHGRGNTQLLFYAALYLRLLWRGWRIRCDAIHCHDLDTLPLGFLLGKLKRKPVVYDAHESFPDMLEGSVHPRIQRALTKLENFLIRRADLLITVGEKLRRDFESRGACRSVVVGNWKRLNEFARTEAEIAAIRSGLGIPDGATAVVSIGNLNADRKLEELLDAADATPGVYVVIGGDGALRAMVEERASRNSRIRYTGFAKGRQIADYTCACDIVYYGFDDRNPNARFSAPNKLFEALAAGRPLITGDFGEIADVVRRFDCGVVLHAYSASEVAKAIAMLSDKGIRQRMGSNALSAGQTSMNWAHAELTLHGEYSRLLQRALIQPESQILSRPPARAVNTRATA